MGVMLQALLDLQEVELQIVDIRRQLARKEKLVQAQAARLKAVRDALDTERLAQRQAQMEIDELDLDIKARTASLNKHREQLNTVRTNKEYAAILAQLNNEKADLSRVESKALELMEKLEGRKKASAAQEQAGREEEGRLKELQMQFEQFQASFAGRLGTLEQRRDAAAAKVTREALSQFNRVSERYEGEVMAEVVRVNPRRDEFICNGCNMSVSAERANALMTRDELTTCRNCGRILYMQK